MPPRLYSRYEFCTAITDQFNRQYLTDRVPYRFQDLPDNRQHIAATGDSLFTLAGKYFENFTDRPCGFWWIIADFQPDPILDPTLVLQEGTIIHIPSERTVREEILNPKRRILFDA